MSGPVIEHPAICLSMIVRNEAHIVHEVLDAVAPYITSWVIVDTGSDDGTQAVIRSHMDTRGIPGELHERPWRNFGHNRSEALSLAQGHGDYIWAMDADDMLVGAPDFSRLSADTYEMRFKIGDFTYWRPQLFRDGVRWRYKGVIHELAVCDEPVVVQRLQGEYHILTRHLGGRNLDEQKLPRDRDILLAEVERNPDDARSVYFLAQTYFAMEDFANARKWYARRAQMGGFDEEVYYSLLRVAEAMSMLGEPWPDVQDALLRAWEFRPSRAEPLYAIARWYRENQRFWLGYLFAATATKIPLPEEDQLLVNTDVYTWRALDEQAVCASRVGSHIEAFTLCRQLLATPDIPDGDRQRITANRDVSVPLMIDAMSSYPDQLAQRLVVEPRNSDVTVSLVAGPDRSTTEQMLNSFLRCCVDVSLVGRFLVLDAGLPDQDRVTLLKQYGFLQLEDCAAPDGPAAQLAQIRPEVEGRFWLHLGEGWRFFAPERFIGRLAAVLKAEPDVFQVGVNFGDAMKLTGACAPENAIRRAANTGGYVITDGAVASGPAMFDTARLDLVGGCDGSDRDSIAELGQRAAAAGLRTASLDEVLCIKGV